MLKYIHDHILEELDGAVDYWTKAVEHRDSQAGAIFRHMAEAELEHANSLTKMFNKVEIPKSSISTTTGTAQEDYSKMYKDILNAYTDTMTKIEAMKKLYWSK